MIRCLAIDDEPLALKQLANFINMVPGLKLVAACSNATEAHGVLQRVMVDAMFCDINMPGINGMDFVKSLPYPPLVVFTTAYSEYALDGYRVGAVDYLLKPFGLDDLRRAAARLHERMGLRPDFMPPAAGSPSASTSSSSSSTSSSSASSEASSPSSADALAVPSSSGGSEGSVAPDGSDNKIQVKTDSLFVKVETRVVRVTLSDIVYIEGMSEYIRIHLCDAPDGKPRKPVVVLYTLRMLAGRLPDWFMRIHRSFIINLRRIAEITKTRVTLETGKQLPIGDLYKDALNDYIRRNYVGKR